MWRQTAEGQVKYKKKKEAKYLKILLPFPSEWTAILQLVTKKFTDIFYMKINFSAIRPTKLVEEANVS